MVKDLTPKFKPRSFKQIFKDLQPAFGKSIAETFGGLRGNANSMSGNLSGSNLSIFAPLAKQYTAGELFSATDAAFIEDGVATFNKLTITATGATQDFGRTDIEKVAQKFQLTASSTVGRIKVRLGVDGAGADSVTVSIQEDDAGAPSGTALGSATISGGSISGSTSVLTQYTLTLSTLVDITGSTDYWLVLERTGALGNEFDHYITEINTGNPYATADMYTLDDGTWTVATDTDVDVIMDLITVANQLYKTDASTTAESDTFLGFVKEDTSSDDTIVIQISGEVGGFTGLTPGKQYYLSETAGQITDTAPTIARKVGIATSSTTLLITNIW